MASFSPCARNPLASLRTTTTFSSAAPTPTYRNSNSSNSVHYYYYNPIMPGVARSIRSPHRHSSPSRRGSKPKQPASAAHRQPPSESQQPSTHRPINPELLETSEIPNDSTAIAEQPAELRPATLNSELHWTVANTQPRLVYYFGDIELEDVHIVPTGKVDEKKEPIYVVDMIKNHPVGGMRTQPTGKFLRKLCTRLGGGAHNSKKDYCLVE
jgi:hypothetical protein